MKPSGLYRTELWRVGLTAARLAPPQSLEFLSRMVIRSYFRLNSSRRNVLLQNLAPPLRGDPIQIEKATTEIIHNFAIKLADLWRYEAGSPIDELFRTGLNPSQLHSLQHPGRGTLLITPHIGNWEFGAPLLGRYGIKLQVITQAEPQDSLTELRKSSRARWGIETIVIGENPFAFVEVIRQLEAGAMVALLIDRPVGPSAVTVKLFGRKFQASIAAAELARASGCALHPVCLPRVDGSYRPVILPEIPYQRAQLGNREARASLTAEIMKILEPLIRQYITQWYHFIPLWKDDAPSLS